VVGLDFLQCLLIAFLQVLVSKGHPLHGVDALFPPFVSKELCNILDRVAVDGEIDLSFEEIFQVKTARIELVHRLIRNAVGLKYLAELHDLLLRPNIHAIVTQAIQESQKFVCSFWDFFLRIDHKRMGYWAGTNLAHRRSNQEYKMWNSWMHISCVL